MKEIIKDLMLLSEPCEQLTFIDKDGSHEDEGREILKDIKEIMEADKSILALSAPQIGIKKRIFGIRFENEIKIFINPIITKKANMAIGIETCASMPGKEILIARPESVTVIYTNEDFKYEDNKLTGYAARIFDQQENLLNGVVPSELGLVSDVKEDGSFGDLTDDEKKEVVEIYRKFVMAKTEALTKALKEDESLEKHYKQMRFAEDVINGRAQVIENPEESNKKAGNRKQRRALAKSVKREESKRKQKTDAQKGKR